MAWDLTYLIVHTAALVGVIVLWRHAPDAIQQIILIVLATAMIVYLGADLWALAGEARVWPVRLIASRVEHTAVLIYILRLVWVKTAICQYLSSSRSRRTSRS